MTRYDRPIRAAISGLLVVAICLTLGACSGNNSQAAHKPVVEITLVGYAVPKAAHNAIVQKFAAKWQREHGQKVVFRQSYGGSGSQTRGVIDGLPADIVHLALASDVNKLVKASLVAKDWETKFPNHSIVARSVAAIVVRYGNPNQIHTFADLARPDLKWVTADPKTSGGARWNFLAVWNAAIKSGATTARAIEFTTTAFDNVVVSPKDSREAMDAFVKQGQGDALLNYENEIIFANNRGLAIEYVVPSVNISIDTPVAIVDKNVNKHGNREVVEAFVNYLFTPAAQAEFVKQGYRPVPISATKNPQFPTVKSLATIADYGGWKKFQQKFFADGAIYDQIQSRRK